MEVKDSRGWRVRTYPYSSPGATAGLLIYPEQELVVAVLTNVQGAPLERGELQLLAHPFLAQIEAGPSRPRQLRDGTYDFEASIGANASPATLTLRAGEITVGGEFTLAEDTRLEVIDAFPAFGGTRVILYLPGTGFLPLRLDDREGHWAGRLLRTEIEVRSGTLRPATNH